MTNNGPEASLLPELTGEQVAKSITDELEEQEHPDTSHSTHITLKSGDAFLITDMRGDFLAARQAMGLFWHGTRFLRTCNLSLESRPLMTLSHHVARFGDACQIDLTNTAFAPDDSVVVEQGAIHVHRHLELQQDQMLQTITVTSFHAAPLSLTLNLKLGADFRDLFEVRGSIREMRGELYPPRKNLTGITLAYRGLDDIERETAFLFEPAPDQMQADRVSWKLQLSRGQPIAICITVSMRESNPQQFAHDVALPARHDLPEPTMLTNDTLFNRLLTRGMHDLMMLSTMTSHGHYPYAGIPWFSCPFGRDGLVTCLEFLPWFPDVVRGTLAFLSAYQGTKFEPFTDEEPGKMLHEFRTGEMANRREIPFIPYYGSIDVTPLFLITLEAYIRWTNDLSFLEQIWPNAQAAASWITDCGDRDGDSFIEYHKASEKGLGNQGWKDSWDAISCSNGQIATSPLALCEVQGYAFAAYRAMSYLANRLNKPDEAEGWSQTAATLQTNFLRHFWWEEEQVFYQALDSAKEPCDVVASNTGQCLWTGIVPEEYAKKMIPRLMREDMFSGWGIRTLSTHAARYNPMSYHNGSVWPHDTAIIGAGFSRFAKKAEAAQLLKSLFEASLYYDGGRLPELYCGFPQRHGYGPTRYPVACSPQAWAAGAPFMLLSGLLGFEPDAEQQRLTLHNPSLPSWLQTLEIRGMHVGQQHVHLRFVRSGSRTRVIPGASNEVEISII